MPRQGQCLKACAQVLADLAADVGRVGYDRIQRVVLRQPLGSGLGAHFVDAGNVVAAIADQRQIIDDLLGPDIKLGFDAFAVQARVAHGVDQRDMRIHQLRHVFVARGDEHLLTGIGCAPRQRADDIVCFYAADPQQRKAQRLHRL